MKYYLAPLEGITGYIFRNALHDHFGDGIIKYFSPFIMPHLKRAMLTKDIQDVLPEHNKGMHLVPQILTNTAEEFLRLEEELREFGYEELNLNLGCPSGTVANKGRGSGFLAHPGELHAFLDEVFSKTQCRISLKTRIGFQSVEEFPRLLEIYNQYPLEELIIHPRVRAEYYNGTPHHEVFLYAMEHSKCPLVYNGDIWSGEDEKKLMVQMQGTAARQDGAGLHAIMCGRGILRNPSMIRECCGGAPYTREELNAFLNQIEQGYTEVMSGEVPVLFKMKEIWTYLGKSFPGQEKLVKKILKSKHLLEYEMLAREIISYF